MNNTLGRQHTKAPLAALSTSSYELVIVCSIDLDPGSLLRQVVMTSFVPAKSAGMHVKTSSNQRRSALGVQR